MKTFAAILLALLLAGGGVAAQEKVSFPSRDADLNDGTATMLDAYLFMPKGAGPFPAMVIHHGCGGMWRNDGRGIIARDNWWANHLVSLGVAAINVDSFRSRQFDSLCNDRTLSARVTPMRSRDSYGALEWLQKQPGIRADRIGVIGFSHGGTTVLGTAWRGQKGRVENSPDFRFAMALYPSCRAFAEDVTMRMTLPLHILIGASDDWTPADPCRQLGRDLERKGEPITLVVYPGVYHQFDAPNQPLTTLNNMINAKGGYGVTVGTDPAARADAIRRVEALVKDVLLAP
jgi:dienelactone hydrolase